jgi:predicted dehydrogenase
MRLETHGSKGALRFNGMAPHFLEYFDGRAAASPVGGTRGWTRIHTGQRYEKPAGFPSPKLAIGWMRSHMQCLYHFLEGVHAGKPVEPSIGQGIYIQRLMDACRRSADAEGARQEP